MNITEFRAAVLEQLTAAKAAMPDAHIHLLYAPELADPLQLVDDGKREAARIRPLFMQTHWPEKALPRLVTLDCRRVAAYMLETDPALDDPLLEASITQAHAELHLGNRVQPVLTNDSPGMAERSVCGWIVSPESAKAFAARINWQSGQPHPRHRSRWVRWYMPDHLNALWPTMSAPQRQALLGQATWLAHDAMGWLFRYTADAIPQGETAVDPQDAPRLTEQQWQTADNVPVVTELTRAWQRLCDAEGRPLPADATQRLHRHVAAARRLGLDAENLALYAMTVAQLPEGAAQAPEFVEMVRQIVSRGGTLVSGLRELPEDFWQRHAPRSEARPQEHASAR